ncbi:hypothetical protein FJR48_05880 [Sulfurimonas lithotrophica]|uniref:Motility protein n=1 Tax=Sulfurimonas lithotrophica TaxID=2590022 RepID=A0A5P8P100_9BACT|nr:hypothetical protein [Sulfurimonas lithotrophica]QFR49281.1 hypothetical protein FJR48_05880 [Sulfurimonas lithotrophica]
MEVSSSTNAPAQTDGKDPMKKATEVQERQVLKILEGLEEQSKQTQQINAQKTGVGNNVNLLG